MFLYFLLQKIKTNTLPPKYSLLRTFSLGYNISISSPNCLRATGSRLFHEGWRSRQHRGYPEARAALGIALGRSVQGEPEENGFTVWVLAWIQNSYTLGTKGEKGVRTLKSKNVEEQVESPAVWTQLGCTSQSSETHLGSRQQHHPSCSRTQQMPTGLPLPAAKPPAGCSAAPATSMEGPAVPKSWPPSHRQPACMSTAVLEDFNTLNPALI